MSITNAKLHDESSTDTETQLRNCRLTFENSTVTFETGPVGTIAKVQCDDGSSDYAGPLPDETIAALLEVGR